MVSVTCLGCGNSMLGFGRMNEFARSVVLESFTFKQNYGVCPIICP